jgi:serine O-acetyltransferase
MGKIFYFLLNHRKDMLVGRLCTILLKLLVAEIPKNVVIGKNLIFPHLGGSIVIHPDVIIKDNVTIYHGVTIGRADAYLPREKSKMEKIIIEEGVVLCAGAKILCKSGTLTIGKNSIIGANAVLTKSTGNNEIWAGVPAKKIKDRDDL